MVRIGLWGTFDVEHLGDMLFPRILRAELGRRVPGLELRTFSPIGYVGLNRYEGDAEPARPLGTWTDERVAELARELDVLVIGGGQIVHGDDASFAAAYGLPPGELERRRTGRFFIEGLGKHEVDVPTAWHAIGIAEPPSEEVAERWREALANRAEVAVRDEISRTRLAEAGVEREVAVVPDPAYLVPRLLPPDALAARIERLRASGAYPQGETLVVQGGAHLVPNADAIAEQVASLCRAHGLVPVLVETEPIHGDARFAEAMTALLPDAFRMPAAAGVEDVVAAAAWSAGAVGSSRVLSVLAAAYGRPVVTVNLEDRPALTDLAACVGAEDRVVTDVGDLAAAYERTRERSIGDAVEAATVALDRHLDHLAGLATAVEVRSEEPPTIEGSTLADERERYAIATRSLAARMAATQAAFAERERDLRAYIDAQARELVEKDIRFTRLWRRLHEGDRHYHWHLRRADEAEAANEQLRAEVEWLRSAGGAGTIRRAVSSLRTWIRPTAVGKALAALRDRIRRRS
jgi:polysaccharide pyruvyl transferase WcaK-like protein